MHIRNWAELCRLHCLISLIIHQAVFMQTLVLNVSDSCSFRPIAVMASIILTQFTVADIICWYPNTTHFCSCSPLTNLQMSVASYQHLCLPFLYFSISNQFFVIFGSLSWVWLFHQHNHFFPVVSVIFGLSFALMCKVITFEIPSFCLIII